MTPTNISEQLDRDESVRLMVYDDATGFPIRPGSHVIGHPTIGRGRSLDIDGITRQEKDVLAANDDARVAQELATNFPWALKLDEARQGVLLNMIFQMGCAGLADFRQFLEALQKGLWESAVILMLDSKWAKIESPDRAERLAQQIRTGQWQ